MGLLEHSAKHTIILKVCVILLVLQGLASCLQAQNSTLKFNYLTTSEGLSQNSVHSIVKDKYGFMWFGTWEGANRFDGYAFKVFRADEDDITALSNNRINAIITDSAQNIWINTGDPNYLFRFNYENDNFTRIGWTKVARSIRKKMNDTRISLSKTASNSKFNWAILNAGLQETNRISNLQTLYRSNKFTPFALSDNVINTIYLDNCENLWIGTQNSGINCANIKNKTFVYYSAGENGSGLSSNVIRAICQDKTGKLWVGTDNDGITVVDRKPEGNSYLHYGKQQLVDPNIRVVYCDRFGFVWIGTKGGLDKYDPRTRRFRHYLANAPGSISNPWVFWVMEDHAGYLWVGTFNGIAKYDRINDSFFCYKPENTSGIRAVRVILEDSKYNLWVATEDDGISKLQRDSSHGFVEKLTVQHYRHIPGNKNSLINNMVLTMTEDADHKIWIGTNSGLCRFDPEKGLFKRFSVKTGFPDDLIMGLLSDGKNHLWISHKKGLTSLDIRTFKMRNYNENDGLQGYEFTQNAYYRSPHTGEMFFGGTNGLNSFYPDSITSNRYKLKPVLTALSVMNEAVEVGTRVNNRVILKKSLLCTDKITLTWWDKNFSLEFSGLNYVDPQGSKFKYMLEGVDHDWVYTDASMRVAAYSHVPSGSYTFKVYAANSDGLWSDSPAIVQLEILPPWWLTWWAKGIYFILFCSLAWFIYRYLSARIEFRNRLLVERIKNEKNEELMDIKLQFFTEISHEFRTPLTLIIDPLEQLLSGYPDEEQVHYYYQLMNRNARQLLDLINQLLDFRKLQSKNLPMTFVTADMVAFVRNVAAVFDQKAEEKHIRFVVQAVEKELDVDFDADKLRKILTNLLSNAFKFTPSYGEIFVQIITESTLQDQLILEVQDSGIGISPENHNKVFDPFYQVAEEQHQNQQGSGIGLALTRELVMLHGGEISLRSEKGKGTCFRVVIPCRQEHVMPKQPEVKSEPFTRVIPVPVLSEQEDASKPLVLMVDDNADIRDYFSTNFRKKYRILTAIDGLAGLNKAIETIPDLIVSDIMMPGIDGIEFCKRLKTDELTSHIPVILLTARQSDESRIEGYETGADAYVTKPFSTEVLGARISNLLEQRLKLRDLFSNGSPSDIRKIAVNITDEVFLTKVVSLMDENMEESDFDPDKLADCLKMSRSQLYRKIKALTNRTVHDFMTSIRLNKAKEYLLSGDFSISEIAYKVGYSLPTNFTRTFTKQFGVSPTKFIEKYKK